MHAISLGHLDSRPFWLGLEPGWKLRPSSRLAVVLNKMYEEGKNC
jgi:hypothetical protein